MDAYIYYGFDSRFSVCFTWVAGVVVLVHMRSFLVATSGDRSSGDRPSQNGVRSRYTGIIFVSYHNYLVKRKSSRYPSQSLGTRLKSNEELQDSGQIQLRTTVIHTKEGYSALSSLL